MTRRNRRTMSDGSPAHSGYTFLSFEGKKTIVRESCVIAPFIQEGRFIFFMWKSLARGIFALYAVSKNKLWNFIIYVLYFSKFCKFANIGRKKLSRLIKSLHQAKSFESIFSYRVCIEYIETYKYYIIQHGLSFSISVLRAYIFVSTCNSKESV